MICSPRHTIGAVPRSDGSVSQLFEGGGRLMSAGTDGVSSHPSSSSTISSMNEPVSASSMETSPGLLSATNSTVPAKLQNMPREDWGSRCARFHPSQSADG
jgi:hypothetical protein